MPTQMQSANHLLRTLHSSHPAFGAWQMLPGPNLTRTICRSSPNISWLLIDLEHGNLSDDGMHEIIAAAASCDVSPIVRVPEGQHWMIKRALDGGAHGILRVVEYSKFPPRGKRGFEALLAVDKFVQQGPEGVRELTGINYLEQADEGLVVAVQIETNGALENVHEIAGIDGIDVLFIGPFDLGVNIGHPIRHPDNYDQELVDAIRTIYNAGRKAGKAVGIYSDTGVQGRAYAEQGFQMISVITDIVGLKTV